jgi:uncharacterized protein (DUF1499 family)
MDSSSEQKIITRGLAPKIVSTIAILSLVAGVALGIYTLFAAVGVWFGMWDFRTGFSMLSIVNASANWIVAISLAIVIGIFFTARRLRLHNVMRLTTFAAIGAVVAILAYVVPETYRPVEGIPPIHDITTNTDNPPHYIAIAPLRADAPNNMVYGDQANWDKKRMAAAQREAYPDIVPQVFSEPKEEIFNRALAAVNTLGWEVVAQDLTTGRIEATATTFWFRFKDDVVIEVTESAQGSILNARSLSRVGTSDVGKNAARLREFFTHLH